VHNYEPEGKYQSMEWKHTLLHQSKKFVSVPFARKVMLMLFWDFNGPILKHFQECGQTVSSA